MTTIIRIIRCALGIYSPSRVVARAFEDTPRGFAAGIGDQMPAPTPRAESWLERWERRVDERAMASGQAWREMTPRGDVADGIERGLRMMRGDAP